MIQRTISLYKTSFTGLSPQTWLLSFIMLINRSGTMVLPFMTLYLTDKEMHRSLSEAGLVMGLWGLGSIIGAFFGGKLSDKIGFQRVQLITLLSGGVMFIVLGQIKVYPLICLTTFILSLVNEAFRPANQSAVAYYSSAQNRTRSYSLNRMSINLGWAIGSSIGGVLATYNYELLFWVDGLTNIAAAGMLFLIMKPVKIIKNSEEENKNALPVQSAYKDRIYLWFIFLVMLFGVCFFQLFTTIPKFYRDDMHLSERFIGFIMALNGLLIISVEMVLIYKIEGKRNNLIFVTWGTFVCGLSFLSLLIPGPAKFIAIFGIILVTIGEITSMPFMNSFWTSRSNEKNRGQYAALVTIAFGTAQTIGPYLCSQLVEATSFSVMFIVLGGVLFLTSFGFWRLNKVL
ncbi:MAG TPA: MFS transporter [Bacteroidia bacterium]|jgi:predicted MFS family arabinose efflux permease|nr:MFS transporter [Bacteroidia bacterium]